MSADFQACWLVCQSIPLPTDSLRHASVFVRVTGLLAGVGMFRRMEPEFRASVSALVEYLSVPAGGWA